MKSRCRQAGVTALLIVLALAVTSVAAAQDALSALDSCVRKLNTDVDIGYERIAARCPDLVRRLDNSGWSAWLPRDWKQPGNDLSAGSLRELRTLVVREAAVHTTARAPRVERLGIILAGLGHADQEGAGWWLRTNGWLREVLERREQAVGGGWLARMTTKIGLSQAVIELTSYGALVVVVLLAGFIVVNELRASGVLGKSRGRRAAQRVEPAKNRRDGLTWNDLERAPFRQKPRVLLELIARRLTEEDCLPPARALTVRELTRAARLSGRRDREQLAELARAAEQVRFSGTELSPDNIEGAVASGRDLLARIAARAAYHRAGP